MSILVPDFYDLHRTYSEKALQDLVCDLAQQETKKEYRFICLFYTLVTVYFIFGSYILLFLIK